MRERYSRFMPITGDPCNYHPILRYFLTKVRLRPCPCRRSDRAHAGKAGDHARCRDLLDPLAAQLRGESYPWAPQHMVETGLPGWAYRIRTRESVRALTAWNSVTTSPEVGARRAAETLALELHDAPSQLGPSFQQTYLSAEVGRDP
jgi:hypothetical protein